MTNITIKTAKAYSSVWDTSARFKEKNVKDVVKHELKDKSVNHLVLAAPTVDISNLDTRSVNPSDNTDYFKHKIEESCQNMIKVAEEAIAKNPNLENVTIMNHAPRFDRDDVDPVKLKSNLASFANRYLLELWLDSPMKNKIFIGSHTLDCSRDIRQKRYTDERTNRYDGVHMYGSAGKAAYTDSVINILLSSFQTENSTHPSYARQPSFDDHNRCPQAKFSKSQKMQYSSAVTGNSKVKTQNRFSPLSEQMGN